MNRDAAQKIADAVLYEGYMLYPYRPSAIKNQQRWSFGTLYPPPYEEVERGTESNRMHTECLLAGSRPVSVRVQLRFLQLLGRQSMDGQTPETWDEGVPRSFEFEMGDVAGPLLVMPFSFPDNRSTVNGRVSCSTGAMQDGVIKLTVEVSNESEFTGQRTDRNRALKQSMLSAHLILCVDHGEFISLLEPPEHARELVRGCKNVGNFPVLLGESGAHDMLLCSPILLYDYPQVAPESAGDFFDATEMDEMLTLRVMTLTDAEKAEVGAADDRVRELLQRTEETAREQLMRTHGTIRSMRPSGGER